MTITSWILSPQMVMRAWTISTINSQAKMTLAQRLSRRSVHYVRLLQEQQNSTSPVIQLYAARELTTSGSTIKDAVPTNPFSRFLSIVRTFNVGLGKLKIDFFTSLYIREAEDTRLFLQRKIRLQHEQHRKKLRLHEKHGIHVVVQEGSEKREVAFIPSNVHSLAANNDGNVDHTLYPEQKFYVSSNYLSTRRPQEQLRQISRDLQVTLPTVAAFVFIPMVGYSFLLLGMMFPRLLLSRQFHTKEQRWHFATKEFGERRGYFDRLNTDFWGSCMRSMPGLALADGNTKKNIIQQDSIPQFLEPLTYHEMDAGGPVLSESSIDLLYNLLVGTHTTASISTLQNTHIHSLALVNNLAAPLLLPSSLSPLFLQTCLPSRYLQSKLTTLAEDIIMDDAALIEERQLDIKCGGMTEEEILDACWMRGLPVGRFATRTISKVDEGGENVQTMRSILTNHLQMMQYAHRSVGNHSRSELVRDEALHLL
eukprot:scaffold3046_cov102-Skeletonema_marinoi.AAC.2